MKLDRLALLNSVDRSQKHPLVTPRQAASILVIDLRADPYKILMGRRTSAAAFMPDVYVYPGGAVDKVDTALACKLADTGSLADEGTLSGAGTLIDEGKMAPSDELISRCHRFAAGLHAPYSELADELTDGMLGPSLALCALRELYEETGLKLGSQPDIAALNYRSTTAKDDMLKEPCSMHPYHGDEVVVALLEGLKFFARAITPPGRKMRFDTRFFAMEYAGEEIRSAIADGELSNMQWVSYDEACDLKLHPMTRVILEDLNDHVVAGGALVQPEKVAFYEYIKDSFYHEVIDFHSSS